MNQAIVRLYRRASGRLMKCLAANGCAEALGKVGEGGTAAPAPAPSDPEYLRMRLVQAFAALPPLLREAYALFQVMELPVAEIARRTGASESLVKVRIFRAKEKLRPLLKDLL